MMLTDYRKEGGKGPVSIEDSVDASIRQLNDYVEKHEAGLITAEMIMTTRWTTE